MSDKTKEAGKDTAKDPMRDDSDVKGAHAARAEKDVVTEGSKESFPASDPPSYMAGSAIAGGPPSKPVKVEPPKK